MRSSWVSSVFLIASLGAGCSPKKSAEPPPAPAAPAPVSSEAPRARAAPVAEAPPEPSPPPEEPEPEPAPPPPPLPELCNRVCEKKMEAKCNASVGMSCRANCKQYEETPAPCYEAGRATFSCLEQAENLPCANIVPDACASQFRRLVECQKAPESFVDAEQAPSEAGPSGFERFEPEGEGFAALMPGPPDKAQQGAEVIWATDAQGVRYFIRKLPPPSQEYTDKSRVRLAMQWLAPCNRKLKLHGQVDTDDGLSVHYDGACEDGAERHGIIHITSRAVFIVGVEGSVDQREHFDTFVYGFKPKTAE